MSTTLNFFEETLIKNHKLPSEWQSQEALDGLLAFLQSNWEQRTLFMMMAKQQPVSNIFNLQDKRY